MIPEKCWMKFVKWLENKDSNWIYRGVYNKDKHLLLPSIGRSDYSIEKEVNLFTHFKRRACQYTQADGDLEWLTIAQHYGLPTRLLDWTMNPLVAVFFACKENAGEGRIYAIKNKYDSCSDNRSPFEIQHLSFIFPSINSRRMDLQRGLFSIHPCPSIPVYIDFNGNLDYMDNLRFSDSIFYKAGNYEEMQRMYYNTMSGEYFFDIPDNCKEYLRKKIRTLGIDELIFGDLDSVSSYLTKQVLELPLIEGIKKEVYVPAIGKCINENLITYIRQHILEMPPEIQNVAISPQKIDSFITSVEQEYSDFKSKGYLNIQIKPLFKSRTDSNIFTDNVFKIVGLSTIDINRSKLMCIKYWFKIKMHKSHTHKFVIRELELEIDPQYFSMYSSVLELVTKFRDSLGKLERSQYWEKISERRLSFQEAELIREEILL